jgi:hypothetical protein
MTTPSFELAGDLWLVPTARQPAMFFFLGDYARCRVFRFFLIIPSVDRSSSGSRPLQLPRLVRPISLDGTPNFDS